MAPEFRPYRAQLVYRGEARLDGAWYEVDLDWRVGGDLDLSYRRLDALFRHLTALDAIRRQDLDRCELRIESLDGRDFHRWVPTRDGEDQRRWL